MGSEKQSCKLGSPTPKQRPKLGPPHSPCGLPHSQPLTGAKHPSCRQRITGGGGLIWYCLLSPLSVKNRLSFPTREAG